jgi:hypothetical protein
MKKIGRIKIMAHNYMNVFGCVNQLYWMKNPSTTLIKEKIYAKILKFSVKAINNKNYPKAKKD